MDTWTNNGNFVGPICMGQKAMKKYLMQSLIKIAFNKYLCIIYIYIYIYMQKCNTYIYIYIYILYAYMYIYNIYIYILYLYKYIYINNKKIIHK